MIDSSEFLTECKKNEWSLFVGTPCSYLRPFINFVIDDEQLEFIETTNEGDAVALASGAWLGGRKAVVMFQNSGLGNAINPLTSLSYTMNIPFIGIVTLRGEVGGPKDEPQHELMGKITTDLLEKMEIPWAEFPTESHKVAEAFELAQKSCHEEQRPFFFVMKKGSVKGYELKGNEGTRAITEYRTPIQRKRTGQIVSTRTDALKSLKKYFGTNSAIVATTGMTGRELFEVEDTSNQLYMVGSMGCALPIGLGLGKSTFKGPVCVVDGDGALLMRLGNMALAGQMRPAGLTHILLDNGVHDSTGGQRTFSEMIDFPAIAQACGYDCIFDVDHIADFEEAIGAILNTPQLSFIRFAIRPGSPEAVGRPSVTPSEVARRMREALLG